MSKSQKNMSPRDELAAFADGELQGPEARRVVERIATDPQTARRVLQYQQLREAMKRTLKSQSPVVPDDLRDRIEQLAEQIPAPRGRQPARQTGASVAARIGRWAPAAIAALLLVSSIAVFLMTTAQPNGGRHGAVLIDARQRELFFKRHQSCAADKAQLQDVESFPPSVELLPARLADVLDGGEVPSLDLSGIGYQFYAAGNCTVPGVGSVHLIYRAKDDKDGSDALSLWIKRYDDRPQIDPGRIYQVADGPGGAPILLWRDQTTIYYLVADSEQRIGAAADALRGG